MLKNRILVAMLMLAMCCMVCVGCGSSSNTVDASVNADKLSVVCTIFPEYDWAREIAGELGNNYEMTLLMDNGADLHNYQPTAQNMAKIVACDIFVYVGGESDSWVQDALRGATNPNMQVINLLEVLGTDVKEEELVEGMQEEHEHEHDEAHEHEAGEEHEDEHNHEHEEGEVEYDEHVWLSLKNTKTIVNALAQAFEKADEVNARVYQENAKAYMDKLSALDQEYEDAVLHASKKTILFGDRFPFRYLVDDYGLDYYAAFVGCSAETEASFDTITFLAGKVDEWNINTVFVLENSNQKIAKTIIENTADKNQNILELNSLQSVTAEDIESGVTYLTIMQENLEALKQALN